MQKQSVLQRFHFLNPRNYLRNLAGYKEPGMVDVEVGERRYRTRLDAEVDVVFGLSSYLPQYNKQIAQAMKDAREYFGNRAALIAPESVCERYSSVRAGITSLDSTEGKQIYATTSDFCLLALKKHFNRSGNSESRNKIAFVSHPAEMERFLFAARCYGLDGAPFTPADSFWGNSNAAMNKLKHVSRELLLGRTIGSFL